MVTSSFFETSTSRRGIFRLRVHLLRKNEKESIPPIPPFIKKEKKENKRTNKQTNERTKEYVHFVFF